jgi:hypothetical protein
VLSGCVNHALRLPAAIAATALLPTYRPQVGKLLRPLGQGSELCMYLFSLNEGLRSNPACTAVTLVTQLYLYS